MCLKFENLKIEKNRKQWDMNSTLAVLAIGMERKSLCPYNYIVVTTIICIMHDGHALSPSLMPLTFKGS